MLQKIFLSLLFCISSPLFIVPTDQQFKIHDEKYGVAPEKRCAQAACRNVENCLLINLLALNLDEKTVSQARLDQVLNSDEKSLSQLQNDHRQWAIWPDEAITRKYNTATNYLDNHKQTRQYFDHHKKYMQGRQIINFYKDMPTDKASISRWVKYNRLSSEVFPLNSYKQIAQTNLNLIAQLSSKDLTMYPDLAHELYQTREFIQESLIAIESDFQTERARQRQEQYENEDREMRKRNAELHAQETQERINQNRRSMILEESRTQAAINLVYEKNKLVQAQKDQNEKISQLETTLRSMNWHQLNVQSTDRLYQLKDRLQSLKANITHDDQNKKEIHRKVEFLVTKIEQEIELKELPEAIAQLERIKTQTIQNGQAAQEVVSSLQNLLKRLTDKQKRNSDPRVATAVPATRTDAQLPTAYAVPAGDRTYNGPVAQAYVVPEETGRCEKR